LAVLDDVPGATLLDIKREVEITRSSLKEIRKKGLIKQEEEKYWITEEGETDSKRMCLNRYPRKAEIGERNNKLGGI